MDRSYGEVTLSASYKPTEVSDFGRKNEILSFILVIDEDTYEITRYEWTHRWHDRDCCNVHSEVGKDLEYGVELEIPSAVVYNSVFAVPSVRR